MLLTCDGEYEDICSLGIVGPPSIEDRVYMELGKIRSSNTVDRCRVSGPTSHVGVSECTSESYLVHWTLFDGDLGNGEIGAGVIADVLSAPWKRKANGTDRNCTGNFCSGHAWHFKEGSQGTSPYDSWWSVIQALGRSVGSRGAYVSYECDPTCPPPCTPHRSVNGHCSPGGCQTSAQ